MRGRIVLGGEFSAGSSRWRIVLGGEFSARSNRG
jgi:hypothetical protein